MHVTDLSTNDPCGPGQWYYLVGKGRNSTIRHI